MTADLWEGISNSSGIDVGSVAQSWVKKVGSAFPSFLPPDLKSSLSFYPPHLQVGFPVVTAHEKDGKLHLRQDRFLLSGSPTDEENETIWWVLISSLFHLF